MLGSAQSHAEGWLAQRKNIARQLTQIRDTASELLSKVTTEAAKISGFGATSAARRRPRKRKGSRKSRPAVSRARKTHARKSARRRTRSNP